ncbi:MAG: tRNA (adenosine(37)-N6)-threonylcarbamoyltransferase complex ATPase subunit type 1 TsaE [Acidimicrobiales bacterium]
MSVAWTLGAHTESPDGTRALAEALAAAARPGDLVLLVGGLGAGKTGFAQGFARGLGVDGPVTSPTFTLVRQYGCAGDGPVGQLLHADLYRLDHLAEVADLALPELLEEKAVALVEWGDVGAPVLGESALEVSIVPGGAAAGRVVTFSGRGTGWSDRRDGVAGALGPLLDEPAASRPR